MTCDLNDLDHYRTYTLHVRAYDEKGNITLLDPGTSKVTIRTVDTQKPTYTSNLALSFGSGSAQLDWSAATDDQYATEPTAQILYQVYRKATTNFANLLNPATDGDLLGETPNRSWTDLGPFASGENYYYTTCATDASGNRKCDGNFKMVKIPDLIAPVIDTFTTTKTATNKTWRLNWTAHDLITNGTKLVYTIKAKASTDATYLVQDTDENILIQEGGSTLLDNLIGPQNTDTYMHYLLIVADEAGNKVSKQLSVYSQNRMVLTSMRSGEGPLSGSKTVFVVGDGFHSSTTVKIGNASCTSVSIITPKHLTCVTPSNSAGFYTATVTNSDGSSASKADAYKYCTPGTDCTNVCNLPPATGWDTGQPFAKTIGRGGSATLPYIICNAAQLQNVSTVGTNKYFELGDNIDLSSYNSNNWVPISSLNVGDGGFIGNFNGKGYAISNLTYNVPGRTTPYGLFFRLGTGSKTENMGLLNFNITAGNYVGALNGCSNNATGIITQDIVVQGNVTGSERVGGMSGEFMGTSYRLSVTGNVNGIFYVGGIAGEKRYGGTDLSFSGTVTSNPTSGQREGHVGGIYGYTDGISSTLSNMTANATVTAGSWIYYRVAGLLGTAHNLSVTNSSFYGTVTCDSQCAGISGVSSGTAATYDNLTNYGTIIGHNQIGGIVGNAAQMVLQNSKNFGNVSGSDTNGNVGGIAGFIQGSSDTVISSLRTSTNSGTVTAAGPNAGGLVGQANRFEIISSSNSGNVNGINETGGLIGRYSTNTKGLSITGSFNTGKVTNSGQNVGGVIGWADRGSQRFRFHHNFYNLHEQLGIGQSRKHRYGMDWRLRRSGLLQHENEQKLCDRRRHRRHRHRRLRRSDP
ncbi:MAG: hypothetical protein EOP07_07730 [Proteobacteria bacterium]|nr:MAG: hypothetical protein EOP07_07730 [Pseudomonadota bacterium]